MASKRKQPPAQSAARCKGTDLGVLQQQAEQAASHLKAAKTALVNAQQAVAKAEESYTNAQRSLVAGVATVQSATKVG